MSANQVMYKEGQKVPVKFWNKSVPMESAIYDQTQKLAQMPFLFKHVAIMPDAHVGKGSTVGTVFASQKAIIPATVGVDIGCGMGAVRLSLKGSQLPDNLKPIYDNILRDLPTGKSSHSGVHKFVNDDRIYVKVTEFKDIVDKNPGFDKMVARNHWESQIGTLGGGNHFVELCLDENDDVWVMLHSGSRNVGKCIGEFFIQKAKEDMKNFFISVPDQDLSYLAEGSIHYDRYLEAMLWAQDYALMNRETMMKIVMSVLGRYLPPFKITEEAIFCHHNYVSKENHFGENVWVTRKGAIQVRPGQLGIIPGSMGTGSFIVRGKPGNEESFCSCSHGAGRVLSRAMAKAKFTLDDHIEATKGIMCRQDEGVIDETPGAYKNILDVMDSQTDLIEVVHTLHQVLNIKG
jgi:tRNA-splicing ligase RtcB